MKEIAHAIRSGATAFPTREYRVLSLFTLVMFVVLVLFVEPSPIAGIVYVVGSLSSALAGAVMGFSVVSLGLLGLALVTFIFNDPYVTLSFAFGASAVALFLRVGSRRCHGTWNGHAGA